MKASFQAFGIISLTKRLERTSSAMRGYDIFNGVIGIMVMYSIDTYVMGTHLLNDYYDYCTYLIQVHFTLTYHTNVPCTVGTVVDASMRMFRRRVGGNQNFHDRQRTTTVGGGQMMVPPLEAFSGG